MEKDLLGRHGSGHLNNNTLFFSPFSLNIAKQHFAQRYDCKTNSNEMNIVF